MLSYLQAEAIPDHADNPVLRLVAAEVSEDQFDDGSLEKLLGQLLGTLEKARGVGLAAPQIGVSKRVFVMSDPQSFKEAANPEAYVDRERLPFAAFAVINPRILSRSEEMAHHLEGCLSIKGYAGIVTRHRRIEVEFSDEFGNLNRLELLGYPARIFQHEFDHLNGILFSDEGRLVGNKFIVAPEGNNHKSMTLSEMETNIADGRMEISADYPARPVRTRAATEALDPS